MPVDPFSPLDEVFKSAHNQRRPLQGVLDAFDEEQKSRSELSQYNKKGEADLGRSIRLKKAEQEFTQPTGVYSWNPLTQAFKQEGSVPKGSLVRNTTTPEDWASKYSIRNKMESPTEAEVNKKIISEGMVRRIQELKQSLSSGGDESFIPGISSTKMKAALPFGSMNKSAQRYQSVQQALADDLLRLKSGAQINEQEAKRLSNLLTKPWRFDEVDIQNLSDFERQFSKIAERINRGLLWDGEKFVGPGGEIEEADREDSAFDASRSSSSPDIESIKDRLRKRYMSRA